MCEKQLTFLGTDSAITKHILHILDLDSHDDSCIGSLRNKTEKMAIC